MFAVPDLPPAERSDRPVTEEFRPHNAMKCGDVVGGVRYNSHMLYGYERHASPGSDD